MTSKDFGKTPERAQIISRGFKKIPNRTRTLCIMKFVDPKNNVAFKKIFGDSSKTEILISFLNAVLELPSSIESLTYTTTYQTPLIEELKYTSLDEIENLK